MHSLQSGPLLYFFLKDHGITSREYEDWADRIENVEDPNLNQKSTKEVHTFIKDPYGLPYIPGSSLKGALRNMLQIEYYANHPEKAELVAELFQKMRSTGRKDSFAGVNRRMSQEAFHSVYFA